MTTRSRQIIWIATLFALGIAVTILAPRLFRKDRRYRFPDPAPGDCPRNFA
jgi:hypothetical protein